MAAQGQLKPQVGQAYPLADAGRAHEDMRARDTTGKVVLTPSTPLHFAQIDAVSNPGMLHVSTTVETNSSCGAGSSGRRNTSGILECVDRLVV